MVIDVVALVALREQRGWSQCELARRSGVGQSTISKIERGEMPKAYGSRQKLAQALGVEERELAGKETEVRPRTLPPPPMHVDGDGPLVSAIIIEAGKHHPVFGKRDIDGAADAAQATESYLPKGTDLQQLAYTLLDAAKTDRLSGGAGGALAVLARALFRPVTPALRSRTS